MRQQTSPPVFNLWRRLPRAAAGAVATFAELSAMRAVVALAVTLGFGTSAAVAVASVGSATHHTAQQQVLAERPLSTASRDSQRPDVPGADVRTPGGRASVFGDPEAGPQSPRARADKTRGPSEPRKARGHRHRQQAPVMPGRSSSGPAGSSSASSAPSYSPSSGAETEGGASGSSTDGGPPQTSVAADYPRGDEAVFSFSADEPASYSCSLDGAAYTPCDPPTSFSDLHPGWHVFLVRAVDDAGNVDRTPAEVRWHADASSASGRHGR